MRTHSSTQVVRGGAAVKTRYLLGTQQLQSTRPRGFALRREESNQSDKGDESAWDVLEEYTRLEFQQTAGKYTATRESRERLREAFLHASKTPYESVNWIPGTSTVLLGIVSSDIRFALRSLRDYTSALGAPFFPPESPTVPLPQIRGSVYIRYRHIVESGETQCTVSTYSGNDRGVLVNFGTMQVGHLPLGLLDEDMTVPFSHNGSP